MQVFTSVTVNYLPKARLLASTLKKFHPEATFHVVLSDAIPSWLADSPAPFDSILHVEELPVENIKAWIFKHNLVELCTAVKGVACREVMRRHPGEPVFYFDPDIVILNPLDDLLRQVQTSSVLLTPHLTAPEETQQAILDNEMCALRHGVYNLGFLGVGVSPESQQFVDWWAERLCHYCYDDIPRGLFTDQRWVDLAPGLFQNIAVLRDPGYNVATWNLTHRVVTGSFEDGWKVNGRPLCFYHFSGFDSGAQQIMLDRFGGKSPALKDLRRWYIEECCRMGQDQIGRHPWTYSAFDNGRPITDHHRRLYRSREDIQSAFPEPFSTREPRRSYYHWFQQEGMADAIAAGLSGHETMETLRDELIRARRDLELLRNSRSYRVARRLSALLRRPWIERAVPLRRKAS